MGKYELKADKSQAGFTLVELAIVMIIIGLLIGGVLKGQELIANAQVNATVAQIKAMDAATTTFRDTYSALPGDMTAPGTRLPDCTATGGCNTAGNGNGRIDGDITAAPAGEMTRFFVHLGAADLITGIDVNAAVPNSWGGLYPAAQIGGGFHVAYDRTGNLGQNASARAGHYLALNNNPGGAPDGTALTALEAARLDRKLDDGSPGTGTAFASAAACLNGTAYDEADATAECDLFIRFQN